MANLIPVPQDFEECVAHPLAAESTINHYVADAAAKGLKRVVLVGCGGSHFGAYPCYDFVDRHLSGISVNHVTSAELTSRNPVWLDSSSLVVAASHSGNTPETVAAAEFAKAKGCPTIGISRIGDNGLSRICDIHLDYPDTITITEPKLMHTMLIALAFARLEGKTELADTVRAGMDAMPHALRLGKDEIAGVGDAIGTTTLDTDYAYFVGAGPLFGQAKMSAWCYSMEMSWMPAAAINGADFFHGPLELTLEKTPIVVLAAEDPSRPLAERVVSFITDRTEHAHVIDSKNLSMEGVPEAARAELSVLSTISASRRVLDHVAALRDHDTSVRRYMYKVAY